MTTFLVTMMIAALGSAPATSALTNRGVDNLTDAPTDAPAEQKGWLMEWDLGFNGSQASYSNWAQGGSNNVAITGSSLFKAMYKKDKLTFDTSLNTRFGQAKIDGDGVRKTDDKLELRNRLSYQLKHNHLDINVFGSINFRTQFDRGFDYDKGPGGSDLYISNFMAPGYLTENIGLSFVPAKDLALEIGMALQQTFITKEELRASYKFNPDERVRNEGGVTLAATYVLRLAENLSLNTSLETFTSVSKSVKSTDFIFKNQITGRINSFMNAGLRFDVAYDDDFSEDLQVAQVLTVGVSFSLF